VNGGPEDKTIIVCRKVKELVHLVFKDADVLGDTGFASNAARKGLVPDPEDGGADSLLFQRDCRFRQSSLGAALFVRTAVDQ